MVAAEPGDRVEVKTGVKTYVGTLMPRPEISEAGNVTLKLDSGYNIGIPESGIESVKLLEKRPPKQNGKKAKIATDASKPTVSILSTGGTIASKVDYHTGGVYASFTAEDLMESMPELTGLANLRTASVMNVMSEDMNPKLWVEMAKAVAKELNRGSDGVVVTHGTDTMHYSTAAMSFLLSGLSKPVVFTGSQRSTDRGSADSFLNLLCSVSYAASDVSGVYLVMHGSMSDNYCIAHQGVKVRKMHTTRRDAFKSVNAQPAARISAGGGVEFISAGLPGRSESKVKADSKLEERVALVKAYPGMDPDILRFHLEKGVKGVVIEGTALGHVPTTLEGTSLIPGIEELVGSGVLVAMTTQCLFGRVNPYVYSNLREVSSRGVIYCEDMLPEVAYVKMMWVLARSKSLDEAGLLMLENVAGEITRRSEPSEEFLDL
ncbi:MAG: Glu-tRNA(Gln) amidotransferase subunit GatD [Candidatus Altiarchaeales archaeon]|nr:Glu-tRNA(Gln) amidotransferase subunit GatD [Candidatus Altiarchaeales archaeon]MBD3416769.1 Glu-tRNA(Gln) amidotransferase subunit GatD [Candidatus Altiarchaeales archaeon]